MRWVVDTCVIIDVLDRVPVFAELSANALDAKCGDGLLIAPTSFVELAPAFNADVDEQMVFLSRLGIGVEFGEDRDAVLAAHRAWHAHICRKHAGMERKRPIADVMIGAYALSRGGLITRNEDDFRSLYPGLAIYNPVRPNV